MMKCKKALKAVKKIKKYCEERSCDSCVLSMVCDEYFWTYPLKWRIKEAKNEKEQTAVNQD